RSFLGGLGPVALFDLPWIPVYLAICFWFHPLIGITAAIGAVVLMVLTTLTEWLSFTPMVTAARLAQWRTTILESSRRNSEALIAMGMLPDLTERWSRVSQNYLINNRRASDTSGGFGAISKVMRLVLQSAVLAVGAYLVINQQASGGIIIAGSILSARALAPIDIAIANWRGWVAARQSWRRLKRLLATLPPIVEPMQLPAPRNSVVVENASIVPPGAKKPVVRDLSVKLQSGNALGVIGPSASGKSALARLLVGYWMPAHGKVCFDGASLDQWSPNFLGRHIGYLPQ